MSLHYLIGSALDPIKKPAIIPHVCNNIGAFGAGFVVPLGKLYPKAKAAYRRWFQEENQELGAVQFVKVSEDVVVANMIGQEGIGRGKDGRPPIRYEAVEQCLVSVYKYAQNSCPKGVTIHAPRFGSKLAGGDWKEIEKIILKTMTVETYIYTLPNETHMWSETYENG